jgi:hypothetical protein
VVEYGLLYGVCIGRAAPLYGEYGEPPVLPMKAASGER